MDRFDGMQLFATVAELQSFAGAARRHGLSPARVTRTIAALEARVGALLLHRTTRAVRLTDAGASYLVQCKRILADVEAAESVAASSHRALTGTLSITAPRLFGRLHVTPIIHAFAKRHPRVVLRVMFVDHVLDFFEQNIDVAIRIAPLPDSSLRALHVGSVRYMMCAAPGYLRARGTPKHPHDLADHDTIGFSGHAETQAWRFAIDGRHERAQVRPRMIVNTADLAIASALAGLGLTRVLSYQVTDELAQKRLRVVLADYEVEAAPVHVVRLEGRSASTRVRAFADFAAQQLRAVLA